MYSQLDVTTFRTLYRLCCLFDCVPGSWREKAWLVPSCMIIGVDSNPLDERHDVDSSTSSYANLEEEVEGKERAAPVRDDIFEKSWMSVQHTLRIMERSAAETEINSTSGIASSSPLSYCTPLPGDNSKEEVDIEAVTEAVKEEFYLKDTSLTVKEVVNTVKVILDDIERITLPQGREKETRQSKKSRVARDDDSSTSSPSSCSSSPLTPCAMPIGDTTTKHSTKKTFYEVVVAHHTSSSGAGECIPSILKISESVAKSQRLSIHKDGAVNMKQCTESLTIVQVVLLPFPLSSSLHSHFQVGKVVVVVVVAKTAFCPCLYVYISICPYV